MIHLLAKIEYISLFDIWAQQFDKLKSAPTCVALMFQMHSVWDQVFNFHFRTFIESCSCQFDKLLNALMSFDLNSNFQLEMESLVPLEPLSKQILGGSSLGVIQHLSWCNRSSLFSPFILFSLIYICCFIFFYFRFLVLFFLFEAYFLFVYMFFFSVVVFPFTLNQDIM